MSRREAEIPVGVANHHSDTVRVRDAESANARAHAVILRLDVELVHAVDRGVVYAECRMLSEIAHVLVGAVAEIFYVLEALRHLEHESEARQSGGGFLLSLRVEYRLDLYAACGVNSVFNADLCNNALFGAEIEIDRELRGAL